MDADKRQQALDNFRNALGRLEQSDFKVFYKIFNGSVVVVIPETKINPDDCFSGNLYTISNHTLRLKPHKK